MSDITYLTETKDVSMTDEWFNIANLQHFWIKGRFDVFNKIIYGKITKASNVAEIGCGNGLVQNQCENEYGILVDGYELNDNYLKESIAKNHKLYCYDVYQKNDNLKEKYDIIILFDILEHIEDEKNFLQAVLFHLKKGGYIAINVPAHQKYFSIYDKIVGHKRRYSIDDIQKLANSNNCKLEKITYWGFMLLPLLAFRKYYIRFRKYNEKDIVQNGFNPKINVINKILTLILKIEIIPQKINGTSILAILVKG